MVFKGNNKYETLIKKQIEKISWTKKSDEKKTIAISKLMILQSC